MNKKYQIQVLVDDGRDRTWLPIKPAGGQPYIFESYDEAMKMLRICYPDCQYGSEVRVIIKK